MTRIKICGITLPDDAARAAAAGVDFIGLNFWPRSKRYVQPDRAPLLAAAARGAGARFDHNLARHARERHPRINIVLAGGLTPETVQAAIGLVEPWAVDVASGVEAAPGIKDPAKLTAFVAAVRAVGNRRPDPA